MNDLLTRNICSVRSAYTLSIGRSGAGLWQQWLEQHSQTLVLEPRHISVGLSLFPTVGLLTPLFSTKLATWHQSIDVQSALIWKLWSWSISVYNRNTV